ncbi:Thioredoxin domain [Chloroherpeton thalassium ATCC 35110]|uniref:Thioredoxin domain n=1 Tax=Chloroherpeton thalassium (strain ATCC 35110 / GB-78) TaxID=517418 RepID=B3QW05_CHLT3|nr:thioredoxin family protein [Chloroherpeton thalassium]ACF14659.1 Thioredoxin domain [Chloroherpeton thalassium ATCC 35110]
MEVILYILGGVLAFFIVTPIFIRLKTSFKKGKPVPELPSKYAKAVETGKPTVFYFYSDNCAACKPMTPIIDKYKKKSRNVFKIDARKEFSVAQKFGVMGTPSTVLVKDGVIAEFLVGPQPEEKISAFL